MQNDLAMWSLLVGFLMPNAIAILQQPRWSDGVRAMLTFVLCLVAGAGTAYFEGELTGRRAVSAVLLVLVTTLATYRNFWKPVGVAPAIESATSPRSI